MTTVWHIKFAYFCLLLQITVIRLLTSIPQSLVWRKYCKISPATSLGHNELCPPAIPAAPAADRMLHVGMLPIHFGMAPGTGGVRGAEDNDIVVLLATAKAGDNSEVCNPVIPRHGVIDLELVSP